MRNDLRLRAEKADVVRDVALQRFPNLFSCETPFSRSLKVCLWNLATENVLARKANDQEPTTNDGLFHACFLPYRRRPDVRARTRAGASTLAKI